MNIKIKNMKTLILFFGVISLFLVSCKKDDVEPIKTKPVDSVRIDYQITQGTQPQIQDVLYKLYFDSNTDPNTGNIEFDESDSIFTIPVVYDYGFSEVKISLTDNSMANIQFNYIVVHWIKNSQIIKTDSLIAQPQVFSGTIQSTYPI